MESLLRFAVLSICLYVCSSQMSQLAFQRALQERINAMREILMQSILQNQLNFAGNIPRQPVPNTDILGQLNTFQQSNMITGNQPNGIAQTTFIRDSRNMPSVVTLNGQRQNPIFNSLDNQINSGPLGSNINSGPLGSNVNSGPLGSNINSGPLGSNINSSPIGQPENMNTGSRTNTGPLDNNINSGPGLGPTGQPQNSNSANDIQVVVENQDQRPPNNNIPNSATPQGAGVQTDFGGNILQPEPTGEINSTFSQLFGSPFGFPSTSASFWTGSPTSSSSFSLPGQTPLAESNPPPIGASTNMIPGTTSWNPFMTGSGLLSTADTNSATNMVGDAFANSNSGPLVSNGFTGGTAEPFGSSQPVNTGNTLSTGSSFTENIMPTSGESITTSPPALTCTEEFKNLPGHTLCMTDDTGVSRSGITPVDKLMITRYHNDLRSSVMPPAEDIMLLKWDERLAAVAEKWAKQCTLGHDKERNVPEIGMSVGQNVAVGYETWQIAIQTWYDEIRDYRYGFDPDSYLGPGGWTSIAHFTQIVHNTTQLIGCGYAECPNTEYRRYYVCNYAAGQSELAYPYTVGSRCGKCINNCNNGLCDCGDLVCYNKGTLDPSTCTCQCPKPYKGRSCETLDCPAEDGWICGRDWPLSFCDIYSNVKEECPNMCGICSGGKVPIIPAANQTFTSEFGCKYSGLRGTQDECLTYGNKGADMLMCQSEGGSVGCGECQRYFNIKRDYCPVMCGLCDPPCKGMKCSNGGTLDTQTCKCTCRPPFTGDTCEYAQCPVDGDPAFCKFWPRRYCPLYYNVPEECPYMCGICKNETQPGNENITSTINNANNLKT